MRLIDADAIVFTHTIARSIDDGHNWNELCVTKDEIDDMPSAEPERTAKVTDNVIHTICCEKCERVVSIIDNYCPRCGAKLDWSGNNE